MAETLGSLCDKLTVVKLKQWHSKDKIQLQNLSFQEDRLVEEINQYIGRAVQGDIPLERLIQPANKVYDKNANRIVEFHGNIGEVFDRLADVNCRLWHQQEKVYAFEQVPVSKKNGVVKQLAVLNLERSQVIDEINEKFHGLMENRGDAHASDI